MGRLYSYVPLGRADLMEGGAGVRPDGLPNRTSVEGGEGAVRYIEVLANRANASFASLLQPVLLKAAWRSAIPQVFRVTSGGES